MTTGWVNEIEIMNKVKKLTSFTVNVLEPFFGLFNKIVTTDLLRYWMSLLPDEQEGHLSQAAQCRGCREHLQTVLRSQGVEHTYKQC